ncbi:MAG: hypothetical protein QXR30_02145 [Candidatus Woesearchaeota archaeon]
MDVLGYLKTYKNLEKFAIVELSRYLEKYKIINAIDGLIIFSIEKIEDLEKLAYFSQSAEDVGFCLFYNETKKEKQDEEEIKKTILNDLKDNYIISHLQKNNKIKYKIEILHSNKIKISENDYKKKISFLIDIFEKLGFSSDLKSFDFQLSYFLSETREMIGISIIPEDLSKRSYKIYLLPKSMKGPLGFLMNSIGEILDNENKKQKNVLFLFSGDGILPIELALWKKAMSCRYFDKKKIYQKILQFSNKKLEEFDEEIKNKFENDKFRIVSCDVELKNLTFGQRNAKLAGIEKEIDFKTITIDFLDYKFQENEFDAIINYPPLFNQYSSSEKIKKFYKDLFYQTSYLLKPNCFQVILSRIDQYEIIKEFAEQFKFSIERIPLEIENMEILKLKNLKKK